MPDDDLALLRTYLADRDVACPNCSYNLRGLTLPSCPECSQRLDIGITLAEPAMGPLIAALAALWTVGGSGLAFLFIVVVVSLLFGSFPPGGVFIVPCVGAIAGTLAAALLSRRSGRRWFRSVRADRRSLAVAACWAFLLVLVLAFIVILLVIM